MVTELSHCKARLHKIVFVQEEDQSEVARLQEEVALEREQRLQADKAKDPALSHYHRREALLSHLTTKKASASTQLEGLYSVVADISQNVTTVSI